MLTGMLVVNLLCLSGALLALHRLRRPAAALDPRESFARTLAAAAPPARQHLPSGPEPGPAPAAPAPDPPDPPPAGPAGSASESLVATLSVPDRLAVLRRMLQGASAEEVAAAAGLTLEAVRALYRLHGRQEKATC